MSMLRRLFRSPGIPYFIRLSLPPGVRRNESTKCEGGGVSEIAKPSAPEIFFCIADPAIV